ncbi:CotH kinase family protein [bacterium]|nr:CotH kinase family protein [bacterium]
MPAIGVFAGTPPRQVSYTNDPVHYLDASSYFLASDNATTQGTSVLIDTVADEIGYCIFEFGSFFFQDQILSVKVSADSEGLGSPGSFEYYVGTSNYDSGRWDFTPIQATTGENEVLISVPAGCISPGQKIYVAVIAHGGAGLRLLSVTGHFLLTGRELDHLRSDLPAADIANTDIIFDLVAEDSGDWYVFGYNGLGQLSSDPAGMTVLDEPQFVEGRALCKVSFPGVGDYELFVEGLDPLLNGSVGQISVYETQLPIYSIQLVRRDLRDLYSDPYTDVMKDASLNIDGVEYTGARVRFRGGSARDYPKKSWKVKLDKLNQYPHPVWGYETKTMNLNAEYIDHSLMREKLSYDLMQDIGVLAPRARFIHLRVNDEYQGLYVDVENPRTKWLSHFGVNDQGSLYKAHKNYMNLLPTPEDYDGPFEKELREEEPFDDLATFILALNTWTPSTLYQQYNAWLDMDRFLKWIVANSLISQSDNMFHNYYLYNDELGSGKWIVIPWDHDLTWGRHWDAELGLFDPTVHYDTPYDVGDIETYGHGNVMLHRYVREPQLRAEYKAALGDALDLYFGEAEMIARIDANYALILPDALADPRKWGNSEDYAEWVEELREYVRQRRAYLNSALAE